MSTGSWSAPTLTGTGPTWPPRFGFALLRLMSWVIRQRLKLRGVMPTSANYHWKPYERAPGGCRRSVSCSYCGGPPRSALATVIRAGLWLR